MTDPATAVQQKATAEQVDAALHARVPGGAEVCHWLPQAADGGPHQTARNVIECAINAANAVGAPAPASPGLRGNGEDLADRLIAAVKAVDELTDEQLVQSFIATKFAGDSTAIAMLCHRVRRNAGLREALVEAEKALKPLIDNAEMVDHDSYILQGCEGFKPKTALKAARSAHAHITSALAATLTTAGCGTSK